MAESFTWASGDFVWTILGSIVMEAFGFEVIVPVNILDCPVAVNFNMNNKNNIPTNCFILMLK
jgi:hypothetical protein